MNVTTSEAEVVDYAAETLLLLGRLEEW